MSARFRRLVLQGPYSDLRRSPKIDEPEDEEEPKEEELSNSPEIPLLPRFEGMWAVGLPGTGKTQLFQYLLIRDLDLVARGEASVVILDPTGTEPGTLI